MGCKQPLLLGQLSFRDGEFHLPGTVMTAYPPARSRPTIKTWSARDKNEGNWNPTENPVQQS